jgi:hypothetical protein
LLVSFVDSSSFLLLSLIVNFVRAMIVVFVFGSDLLLLLLLLTSSLFRFC